MAPKRNLFLPQYEHKSQPLASTRVYYKRVLTNLLKTICILGVSLMIGILGYKFLGPMSWIDALHNASMILSGMGPIISGDIVLTNAAKVFASPRAASHRATNPPRAAAHRRTASRSRRDPHHDATPAARTRRSRPAPAVAIRRRDRRRARVAAPARHGVATPDRRQDAARDRRG